MNVREDTIDFVKRDRKSTIGEGGLFATKTLLSCVVVYAIGVPVSLLGGLINLPFRLMGTSKPQFKKFDFPPVLATDVELKPLADREFDIVVFGATGYTGELAAKYLQKQYGSTVKWAIAGRRLEALEQVKQRLGGGDNVNIISGVDSFNEQSLLEMCARTKVVVSTVGPFQNYGTPLVRACIASKTNYCDITGEADWYAGLVEAYDSAARAAGVRIVSFCGHDSVPWDLMTFMLAKRLRELNNAEESMLKVHMEDEAQSGPSGGTVATIQEAIANGGKRPASKLAFNPILLTEQGTKSAYETKDASPLGPVDPSVSLQKQWGGPFIMSMVNAQVVRRSNALNGYGKQLTYSEVRLAPTVAVLLGRYFALAMLGPVLALPAVLQKRLLPQPGTGPSQQELDKGFLQVTGRAVGVHGTQVAARLYFDHDVGYPGTGRLLVESGLCIAQTPDKCERFGGVLTPATCMGEALLQRLVERGTEFIYLK